MKINKLFLMHENKLIQKIPDCRIMYFLNMYTEQYE